MLIDILVILAPLEHEEDSTESLWAMAMTSFGRRLAVYGLRFLSTLGHPHAVALHFVRRDQLKAGLHPQESAHAGRTK